MSDEKQANNPKPIDKNREPKPTKDNNNKNPPFNTGSGVDTKKTSYTEHKDEHVDFSKKE